MGAMLTSLCLCQVAKGQIAYSARYYNPPGSKKLSHFHVYEYLVASRRVEQLTRGNSDDVDVCFSPDGKYLGFIRRPTNARVDHGSDLLCLYSMARHRIVWQVAFGKQRFAQPLNWIQGSDTLYLQGGPAVKVNGHKVAVPAPVDSGYSPNRQYVVRSTSQGGRFTMELTDAKNRKSLWQYVAKWPFTGAWLAPHTYVVLAAGSNGLADSISTLTVHGGVVVKATRRISYSSHSQSRIPHFSQLMAVPVPSGFKRFALLAEYAGNSTIGPAYWWWRIDTQTGEAIPMGTAAELAISPNPDLFAIVTTRRLKQYGRTRSVWVSSIDLHAGRSNKVRAIVQGLVDIESISWRYGHDIHPSE